MYRVLSIRVLMSLRLFRSTLCVYKTRFFLTYLYIRRNWTGLVAATRHPLGLTLNCPHFPYFANISTLCLHITGIIFSAWSSPLRPTVDTQIISRHVKLSPVLLFGHAVCLITSSTPPAQHTLGAIKRSLSDSNLHRKSASQCFFLRYNYNWATGYGVRNYFRISLGLKIINLVRLYFLR